jgi:acetylornithine deacetylase/succinyl-diaminopimelate desuccinylase-like protein
MSNFSSYFESNKVRFFAEWREFLSLKSISADPAFYDDCAKCAEWLKGQLVALGVSAQVWSSQSKPIVYGELLGNPKKPVVLFYGHYDVQPVDPLELWTSDPFTPTLRDGRVYARGAQDNKGQLSYFLKALEALKKLGVDLPTIKILIEGEEESGSCAMHAGLAGWGDTLKADILMVCDTTMIVKSVPTITMGLRGNASLELRLHGAHTDLHSGVYGGMVLNPLQALSTLLASAYNPDGSIAIPGFYDGVKPPPEEDRALAHKAPLNVSDVEAMLGVPLTGGERHLSAIERRGFRPTLELNGLGGGYQGAGSKTVIPNFAFAKLTMRLVVGQDPQKTVDTVAEYLLSRAPAGVRAEIIDRSVAGPALQLSTHSELIKKVTKSIKDSFGCEPVFMWEGASIPIVTKLSQTSGAEPLLVGFGLEEDQIHAPNESFSLEQFEMGYRYVTGFLSSL